MRSFACAALLLALAACKRPDPKDPAVWMERLSDAEANTRVKAVQQLRKLHAKDAAPLIAALLKDRLVRDDAALALQDLGGPDQVQPLLEAVDTTVGAGSDEATRAANRTNARIAQALGNIGDRAAGPTLLRLARSKDESVRLDAVEALGQVRFTDAVGELSRIIDDETTPPLLMKKAVVALGQIRHPSAIPALQHALVLDRQGVSFLPEASYALFLFGDAAVDPMIRVAKDEDAKYVAWAKDANRAPAGTYAKAALVLGDLGSPRAVPVLIEKLKYKDSDPNPGTARLLTNLVRQFACNALGRLRAQEAAQAILAQVQTRDPQDDDLVTFCSEALVWIGDRSQAKELLTRAASGAAKLRLTVAQAAALFAPPELAPQFAAVAERQRREPAAVCQKSIAELQAQDAGENPCEFIAVQFAGMTDPLHAAKTCAAAAPCWIDKLRDKDPLVRARAAYELGRLKSSDAVSQLVVAAGDPDLLVRVAAIRALEWMIGVPAAHPQLKAAAAALAAQLAAEQGRTQFVKVDEELKRLQARLAAL
jgi:HEAT repeat protein